MGRIRLVQFAVLMLVCALALYLYIAHPVVVLPPITVAMPENTTISAYQRRFKINQLDVTLRTNGRLSVAADGQRLAFVSYNLDSLRNSMDLAGRLLWPNPADQIALLFAFVLVAWAWPQLVWSAFLAGLSVCYLLPVEITLRFIPG